MERCSSCSAEISATARFCPACGTPRSDSTELPTRTSLGPPPAQAATPPPTPSHPSLGSDSFGGGRFIPGTMLAGRYRVIGLIGKGGMGEVYRADDVKLGQAVALKFLPAGVGKSPDRLARFFNEVRTARQVTHPNVCRVYDIDEVDGQQFISMELVDGEDLATLLRRIGRLPKDKAVQMARQLCAGLAAAHDQGILHRDLKPANIMIDGRGRVKITDFGLAGLAGSIKGKDALAGTPAYMAPEQLAGRDATVRSDLYSLGLLLYELFTGKPAFKARSAAEFARLKSATRPTSPSSHVEGFDPAVERVILRCLEPESRERPASALAIASALPGGDPLAAALEAGETPSPELVAEAGGEGGLRPPVAIACLAFLLAGLAGIAFLQGRYRLYGRVPLDKHPEVLAANARTILAEAGYTDAPVDQAFGFSYFRQYMDHIGEEDDSPSRWDRLETERPTAIHFWYRQSPRPMVPDNSESKVLLSNPPQRVSGMAKVFLDSRGRLVSLLVIPPQRVESGEGEEVTDPDWSFLFEAADLEPADFTGAEPEWQPEAYCDRRAAWTGTYPDQSEPAIRVEACAFRGKVVYFEIIHPWERPRRMQAREPKAGEKANAVLFGALYLTILGGAFFLARRNMKLGRGDRRGAFRLALFIFLVLIGAWVCQGSHLFDVGDEISFFERSAGGALFDAGLILMMYLALEPFVRRRWPETLISWSRLIDGRIRDPRVGRDMLFGASTAMAALFIGTVGDLLPVWLGWAPNLPHWVDPDSFLGVRSVLGEMFFSLRHSIYYPMILLFILVFLRFLLRKQWLAVGVVIVFFSILGNLDSDYLPLVLLTNLLIVSLAVFCAIRFGLLSLTVFYLVAVELPQNYPVTLDFSAWYAGGAILPLLLTAALAIYCFYISLAGKPLFAEATLQEETA